MQKFGCWAMLALFLAGCTEKEPEQSQPNIIFFLADDLGYGETGAYGQEKIQTPNIDALAKSGMKFTQFYSGAPVCAPARCVLLTGLHTGHAYIRGNDEWRERGEVWNYEKAVADPKLEGQRPIPAQTVTVAKLLKQAGYTTGIFGKWGLGAPETEGVPTRQGFDYFFGYNCQRQAHNLYPPHLWENETKVLLENEVVAPTTKLDSLADIYDEASYAKFQQKQYGPELIHQKAVAFIHQNKENPFFLYYASPLPHLPLQIPMEYVNRYRAVFGEEAPYDGSDSYFPNRYPRAAYAAMISYLDQQLGELVATLKELGLYENTIILFSSDNGPTYLGGVDVEFFNSARPFSNADGRTKGYVYEGGIRVPFIASWPGHIAENTANDHVGAFYDVLPTLCDVAGIQPPAETDGISFKPALLGKKQTSHDFLYWEFPEYKGQQAVRWNNWKGIRKNIREGNRAIELYDLSQDMGEQKDVSQQFPQIVHQIDSMMHASHRQAELERFRMKQLRDELDSAGN